MSKIKKCFLAIAGCFMFFLAALFFSIQTVQAAAPAKVVIDNFSIDYSLSYKTTGGLSKDAVVDGKKAKLSWKAHTEPAIPNPLVCNVFFTRTDLLLAEIFTDLVTSGTSEANNLETVINPAFIEWPGWPWGGHVDPYNNYSLWLVCGYKYQGILFTLVEYEKKELKITVVGNEASYIDTNVCCGTAEGTCEEGIAWTVTKTGSAASWVCSDINETDYNKLPRDDKLKHVLVYCGIGSCDECTTEGVTCEGNSAVTCADLDNDGCNEKTVVNCGAQQCISGICCDLNLDCTPEKICKGSTCTTCGKTVIGGRTCLNANNWKEVAP